MINSYDNTINNLPKIDLHCHLDGSLSEDFVRKALGLPDDFDLKSRLTAPRDCASLKEYLTCFDIPIQCLQTYDNIKNGVLDVIRQAAAENVKYLEIRFAPSFSVNENLSYDDIYRASIDGVTLGRRLYNVESNIIVCAMRHLSPETNMKVLKTAMPYLGYGICALDLAGDEAAMGNEHFTELFETAKCMGMPFTIHSGECGSSNNVKIALELGARRVGHGIALIKDAELIKDCAKKRLGLELCPTSNFQTKAVLNIDEYPLRCFMDMGLLATINTDNRTVSNTNMVNELHISLEKLKLKEEELITIYKNSIELSFASDNVKNKLLTMVPVGVI